jgi:hypothetical protein
LIIWNLEDGKATPVLTPLAIARTSLLQPHPRADANMAQQNEKIEQYQALMKGCKGGGLRDMVGKALAEPGLFAFGELVAMPNLQQVRDRAQFDLAAQKHP